MASVQLVTELPPGPLIVNLADAGIVTQICEAAEVPRWSDHGPPGLGGPLPGKISTSSDWQAPPAQVPLVTSRVTFDLGASEEEQDAAKRSGSHAAENANTLRGRTRL